MDNLDRHFTDLLDRICQQHETACYVYDTYVRGMGDTPEK